MNLKVDTVVKTCDNTARKQQEKIKKRGVDFFKEGVNENETV
jgi:hypothetical protein